MAGIKDYYLNQYKDIASQANIASQAMGNVNRQNLSYADSPIFQKGYEAWNPTGLGSLTLQNLVIPMANVGANPFMGSDVNLSGAAGVYGDETSAAFANKLINPVFSGTATTEQKQKFANVFGHEMSHLGWDYKNPSERINVPGVGIEGDKAFAKQGSSQRDYGGEEQWNYLHDLTYNPRGYSSDKFHIEADALKSDLASGKITQEEFNTLGKELVNQHEKNKEWAETSTHVTDYLTDKGLINPGDLSYTPKAYNEIAWSGLTTPSKQAIGFGINPFEDTRAAGQWYAQQKYRKMSQAKKQAQMQQTIRREEAAAKQKAAADAQAQASLQAQVTAQANREARRRVSQGEARDYGKTETRASSGWESSPFAKGGLADLYRYGGFSG